MRETIMKIKDIIIVISIGVNILIGILYYQSTTEIKFLKDKNSEQVEINNELKVKIGSYELRVKELLAQKNSLEQNLYYYQSKLSTSVSSNIFYIKKKTGIYTTLYPGKNEVAGLISYLQAGTKFKLIKKHGVFWYVETARYTGYIGANDVDL